MATTPNCCELEVLLQAAWAEVMRERPAISEFLGGRADHDAYERAVAFRVGHHLARSVESERPSWTSPNLTVDMELRRRAGGARKVPTAATPDLIIHVRGNRDANLLVVEFKASSNRTKTARTKDRATIHALVTGPLRYLHGVRGIFDVEGGCLTLTDWLHRDSAAACTLHPGFVGSRAQYLGQ